MQPGFNSLSQQKIGGTYQIPHFNKVIEGQLCNGIGVRFSMTLKCRASQLPIVIKLIQQLVEDPAVFKTRIHALSIEGHNTMGCIAQEEHVFLYPRITPDSNER